MKRKIIIFVFFFIGYMVFGQADLRRVIVDGNLSALNRVMEWNEIWDLSQSELRILRNTIFAKYGYIFRSEDLQIHFRQFAWYNAINANVDNSLSTIDNENITRIQRRESSLSGLVTFQNRMLEWVRLQNIPSSTITNISGMNLFQNPILHPQSPDMLEDSNRTTAFCFAMGRFLSRVDSDRLIQNMNAIIRKNNEGARHREAMQEEIDDAIIFNPSVLFLSHPMFGRVYRTFQEAGIYLIVYLKDGQVPYKIQADQILDGSSKSVLIFPWSVTYYVYKITSDGSLVLVDFVAAN
jgi:hypothetical protein